MKPANSQSSTQRVLNLLQDVSQKLSRDEKEREKLWREIDSVRNVIMDLEDKSEATEKVYLSLRSKLNRENAVGERNEKWQKLIEDNQKALQYQIQKATDAHDGLIRRIDTVETTAGSAVIKMDDVVSEQKRLTKRLENVTEDRSRLLKKMEGLEEALIQTQDTLRAKALVLLTDQAVSQNTQNAQRPQTAAFDTTADDELYMSDDSLYGYDREPIEDNFADEDEGYEIFDGLSVRGDRVENNNNNDDGVAPIDFGQIDKKEKNKLGLGFASEKPYKPKKAANANYKIAALASLAAVLAVSIAILRVQDGAPLSFDFAKLWGGQTEITTPLNTGSVDAATLAVQKEADALSNLQRQAAIDEKSISESVFNSTERGQESVVARAGGDTIFSASYGTARDFARDEEAAVNSLLSSAPSESLSLRASPDTTLPDVVKKIEKLAFEGDGAAQHDLAAIYTAGHAGVQGSYEKAAFWFKEASYKGIANARYNLGVLTQQGLGVTKDEAKAIELYKTASFQDHPEAQYNLGIAYVEGVGVGSDVQRAAYYFERAAQNGVLEAAYNLGLIYENGLTGTPQPEEALFWYKMAADKGNPEARVAMDALATQLNLSQSDVNKLVDRLSVLRPALLKTGAVNTTSTSTDTPQAITQGEAEIEDMSPVTQENSGANIAANQTTAPEPGSNAVIVAQIQEELINLGLHPGPADGVSGQITQDAVRSYQSANGLDVTGVPSEDLLVHMLATKFDFGQSDLEEFGSR